MKNDEKRFLIDIYNKRNDTYLGTWRTNDPNSINYITPRDIINSPNFYMHYKRAWYILDKWSGKGWYEYGVALDLGWLTPEGIQVAEELIEGNNTPGSEKSISF